jgi:uncharacterized protein YbjT (DUF2867 family)
MTSGKTIIVTGATGAQGGSVARHLLAESKFNVRALTRNPNSEKARTLKEAGAEVVKGDFDDLESLQAALAGCSGVFGVTNFWEHFHNEYTQGKNLIDAVAASGVEHFVFSSLPHAKEITEGKIEVPHFDSKARLEEYTRSLGLSATFVHVAFYFENFLTYFPPQPQRDSAFVFGFPQGDTPLAGVAVEDLGGVVAPIFEGPADFKGRTVGVVGDDLPPKEYAEIMTRVLGKTVVYNDIPRDTYAALDFPGAGELADMFEFNRLHIPNRQDDLTESRSLYPQMQTFESWLETNKEAFRGIMGA